MADLKRTEFGKVDLDYVLGIGGFDLERLFLFSWYILAQTGKIVCVSHYFYI